MQTQRINMEKACIDALLSAVIDQWFKLLIQELNTY